MCVGVCRGRKFREFNEKGQIRTGPVLPLYLGHFVTRKILVPDGMRERVRRTSCSSLGLVLLELRAVH